MPSSKRLVEWIRENAQFVQVAGIVTLVGSLLVAWPMVTVSIAVAAALCIFGIIAFFALLLSTGFAHVHGHMQGQMRMGLLELLALVVVIGSAMGLTIRHLQSLPGHESRILDGVLMSGLQFTWIAGGALWGMWAANKLRTENAWRRVGLMAMGWTFPLALYAFMVSIVGVTMAASTKSAAPLALAPLLIPALIHLYFIARIHGSARTNKSSTKSESQ